MYCQICSHGLSSGLYGGILSKYIFSGISMFFVEWNTKTSKREKVIEFDKLSKERGKRRIKQTPKFYKLINQKLDLLAKIEGKKIFDTGFNFQNYDLKKAYKELDHIDKNLEKNMTQSTIQILG